MNGHAKALPIYQAAIGEMVTALQYVDDSNGEIGSVIEEGRWGQLLGFVKSHHSFHTLECYHEYLAPHFPSELAELYAQAAKKTLAEGAGAHLVWPRSRQIERFCKKNCAQFCINKPA